MITVAWSQPTRPTYLSCTGAARGPSAKLEQPKQNLVALRRQFVDQARPDLGVWVLIGCKKSHSK
jgi:hypothetical protein